MDAILAELVGAHTPDAPPPLTSSQMATPLKASSSAPPDTIDLVDEEEVLPGEGQEKQWGFSEEVEEGEEGRRALPEEVEESEEEQEVALIRKRKGIMVAQEEPKRQRRADTPAHGLDGGISPEMEEHTAPPNIVLTPVHGDEARQELRIAKHNYAMDEYSRGYADVEALKRVLRVEMQNTLNDPNYQNPWDLNLDPLSDWFGRFLGPTLAPFAAEMTSEFASQLTRCAPRRFAACASLNSIFQVQGLSHSLTVLAAEAGRLSKNIINHGFVLSDFGGMDEVKKILQDLTAERRLYQEDAEPREALAKASEEEAKRRQ
ncbi:hypothetical protein CsatB_029467 [Cannabis sativa]